MTPDVAASYDVVCPGADFIRRGAIIPMRDGVKLYTVVGMKKGTANAPPLPSQTPRDANAATSQTAS